MTWLIFIAAGLVIFGSVYWLKPSPRDTRIAALRLDAIKLGLQVRHHSFQPDSAKSGVRDVITGTSYSRMNNPGKPQGDLRFRIVGQPAWDSEGLPEGLSWHDKSRNPAEDCARIQEALASVKDPILLLEVYDNRVMLIAAENREASAGEYKKIIDAFL